MRLKSLSYSLMATAGLLLSTACSNEDELSRDYGNEALVSFKVDLSGGMQTKAISDGTTATNLDVKVFDESMNLIPAISKENVSLTNKSATVSFKLVKGKTYSFLFWADAAGSPYTIGNDGTITVDYTKATANDENRDAFLAVDKSIKVDGSFEKNVTLKRPFAQLNFLTDDIVEAGKAGLTINNQTKSSITISNAATTLNPFTNTVSGQQDVTFAAAAIPAESETYTISNKPYRYLGTTYFLVNAAGTTADDGKKQSTLTSTNLKIAGAQGNGLTVANVPVQWNYRTNIYGSLLTATGNFNVTISPDYNTPDQNHKVEVVAVDQVDEAINNGATDIVVAQAPTQDAAIIIPKKFEAGNSQKISLTIPSTTAKITISEGNQQQNAPKEVVITAPTTNDLAINLPNSTVTLNGQRYTSVTATTAANTLIIPKGVEVTNLTVNKGNVEIYGKITNISLAQGYNDQVTTYAVYDKKDLDNAIKAKAKMVVFKSSMDISSGVVRISHDTKFQLVDGVVVKTARQNSLANIVVESTGALTIEGNGTISGDNRLIDVNGSLVVNGGKYRTSTKTRGSIITANVGANVEINNCDMIAANCVLWIEGNMVINGGKMVSTNSSIDPEVGRGWSYAVRVVNEKGNLTIHGGEVEGIQGAIGLRAGKTTINGGYFHTHPEFSASDNYYALYCSDGVGEAVVNGGKFYAQGKPDVYTTTTGKVTLNGGKFEDKGFSEITKGEIALPSGYDWKNIAEGQFKLEVVKSIVE